MVRNEALSLSLWNKPQVFVNKTKQFTYFELFADVFFCSCLLRLGDLVQHCKLTYVCEVYIFVDCMGIQQIVMPYIFIGQSIKLRSLHIPLRNVSHTEKKKTFKEFWYSEKVYRRQNRKFFSGYFCIKIYQLTDQTQRTMTRLANSTLLIRCNVIDLARRICSHVVFCNIF